MQGAFKFKRTPGTPELSLDLPGGAASTIKERGLRTSSIDQSRLGGIHVRGDSRQETVCQSNYQQLTQNYEKEVLGAKLCCKSYF